MHEPVGPDHVAAERLADGLVAEADAEQRHAGGRRRADQRHADAGLARRAGAGRDHDRGGLEGERLVDVSASFR